MQQEQITIRKATPADAALLTNIEAACFPPAEAASRERFDGRLAVFADHFFILQVDGRPVGFINGMVTEELYIEDVMFEKAQMHRPDGAWQSIFGLDVLPQYRRRGYAARLMDAMIELARSQGRRGVTLTCKEHMLHYYAKFGFVPLGASASQHGGARWFDMVLEFTPQLKLPDPVKAVFFDLDGTLVDSVPMIAESINRIMRAKGLREFSREEIAGMVGKGARVLIERVCEAQGVAPTLENVQALVQGYAAEMLGPGLPQETFYPGTREALEDLHAAGLKIALVTNKMRIATEHFVKHSGLDSILDVIVAGDDTDHPKPEPDMLLLACRKTGVSPSEAVMVGDSENDAYAARAAGIRAMLVTTGYNGAVPMDRWAAVHGFDYVFKGVPGIRDYLFACQGRFQR